MKEIDEREINLKILPFINAFAYGGKINFITAKGLFNWKCCKDEKVENKLENQIVINQVEMMQYPIERFSFI